MRVALVSPLFESVPPKTYGGTERVVDNLCRGLTNAGVDVTLFASGDSNAPARLIPVMDESLRLSSTPFTDPSAYHFKMLGMIARRADEFDLIHNHHDYWIMPLTRMTDTPILTTLHGRLDLPGIGEAYEQFPGNYVSISDAQRKPLPALNWRRTVHHGIDVESFAFQPKPENYLAFLGRIGPDKRPEWAISIAKASGIPLKIAAKIEERKGQEYYDEYVKPHVDGRFIQYVGEISEKEKSSFLGDALALVFPIDWPEPFGLVMIEALACGTPVLARPCGSVPEILGDGITGFCERDIGVLARKVRDLARIDRAACREWVRERFGLERMTEDYIDVYRELGAGIGRAARHRRDFLHSVERAPHGDSEALVQGRPRLRGR